MFNLHGLLSDYDIFTILIILAADYVFLTIGMIPIIIYDHIQYKRNNEDSHAAILKRNNISKRGAIIVDILVIGWFTITWPAWALNFICKRV